MLQRKPTSNSLERSVRRLSPDPAEPMTAGLRNDSRLIRSCVVWQRRAGDLRSLPVARSGDRPQRRRPATTLLGQETTTQLVKIRIPHF